MLDDDSVVVTPTWHRVLTLEAFLALMGNPGFARDFHHASPAQFVRAVESFARMVQQSCADLAVLCDTTSRGLELCVLHSTTRQSSATNFAQFSGTNRLGDGEPPHAFSASLALTAALECIVALIDVCAEVQSDTGAAVRVGALRRHASSAGVGGRPRARSAVAAGEASADAMALMVDSLWKVSLLINI